MQNFVLLCLIVTLMLAGVVFLVFGFLYLKFGICHRLYHDILDWHQPDPSKTHFDFGAVTRSKCRWCGKGITQDSQGNWF